MLLSPLVLHTIVKEEMTKKHYEVTNAPSLQCIEQSVGNDLRVHDRGANDR